VISEELAYAGLVRQAELVRSGEVSSVELTAGLLERIQALDPALGAFRAVLAERALDEAAARDRQVADRGPLHGVPVAVKDENDVAGEVTTYGGSAQRTPATQDAEVVRRLRAAGAVVLGKTRMSEFGQWPYTESVAFGITRNPWDTDRSPGGSSGGSAVAVATGMVAAAVSGDGGGSIRIPAAWCGLYGLKPQRGRVSAAPYDALWGTLGTIGPLTRSVADAALFYDVVRGTVPADRWHAAEPPASYAEALREPAGRLQIGVTARSTTPGITPGTAQRRALDETAELLAQAGHHVEELPGRLPDPTAAFVPQFYGSVRDEATRVERPDRLERRTRQTLLLARAYPPAVVRWAERRGEALSARVDELFERYDLLLTPTVPGPPPRTGVLDGLGSLRAALRSTPAIAYTAIWNVAGNPAAAVPAGLSADGLPLSVQLVGPRDGEPVVLRVSAQLESARPWAELRPPL
jgi:amidase